MQSEYKAFSTLLVKETKALEVIKLPPKRKIKELANLNIANNFGNIGNLLRSLVGGALDVGGFLGSMFPGKGKLGEPDKAVGKPAKPIPSGKGLRFGGLRSIGIVNSIFAGLDFATGLAEGESIGKSAAVGLLLVPMATNDCPKSIVELTCAKSPFRDADITFPPPMKPEAVSVLGGPVKVVLEPDAYIKLGPIFNNPPIVKFAVLLLKVVGKYELFTVKLL